MKKRIFFVTLLLLISMLAFSSCFATGDNGTGDSGDTNNGDHNTSPDNTVKNLNVSRIVYGTQQLELVDVRSAIYDIVGIVPIVSDAEPAIDGEIVFGNSNRQITQMAKDALDEILENDAFNDCGYIIYVNGNDVAVYWDVADMAEVAIIEFITLCVEEKMLVLDNGTQLYSVYEKSVYDREKYWIALESVAEPEVVEAIKKMYNYYNGPGITDWLANLYDPGTGGIYYSRSARDNVPFLPDLESTAQGIAWLINNNAIENRNVLPDEIKEKFINFAKDMQCAEDGYFYHPQWPQGKENLPTDRYGRDMGWATTLITQFYLTDEDGNKVTQYPNWCAPNGVKCALHNGTEESCSFPATVSYYTDSFTSGVPVTVGCNVSSAVSRLTSSVAAPVAEVSSRPDYSSPEAFSEWLEAYNATIKENSGRAHNLAALKSEIAQHGYTDIVLNHLDRVQAEVYEEQIAAGEEPTGLWQRNVDYNAVWGLLKYMSFYGTSRRIDIKYVPHIARTCVEVIQLPVNGDYASNDLYNQWSGISNLISNVRRFYEEEGVQIIYDTFRESAPQLIDRSLEKIEPFRMDDGSFASRSNGMTGSQIYSVNIALGVSEGNVNSTALICSMYRSIFPVLGLPTVPLCTPDDGERFIETICSLEEIDKEADNAAIGGTVDFENSKIPTHISANIRNSGASLELADDPEGEHGTSLNLVSTVGESGGDGFGVTAPGKAGNCYVFESDIYVNSDTANTTFLQIRLDEVYMICMTKSDSGIRIRDSATTSSINLKANDIKTVSADTWFNIRVEYYVHGEAANALSTPLIKIFVDDEHVFTSDNFYGSHNDGATPKKEYTKLNILSPRAAAADVYFDNFICDIMDAVYEE